MLNRFFLTLCSMGLLAVSVSGQASHLVLISVDGLRPEFYRDASWPAPMMQQLAAEGARAKGVRGIFPTVTYPSHTTLVTGALPARHGIVYNSPFEPGVPTGRGYWEEEMILVPTLWDAVKASGGTIAAISWPVTVGAPIDYNIPELWSIEDSTDTVTMMRQAATPPGLMEEIEREATGRLTADNFTIHHMTRDDRAGAAGAYLFEHYRPTLLAVHLFETDHFQHEEGRHGPRVRRAVAAADRAISQIYEAVERSGLLEQTAFVITGDHGFIDVHTSFNPNILLVEAGLRTAARDRGDWRATFQCSGAAGFLHLRDSFDRQAANLVRQILTELPAKHRKLFRVVERDELDALGASPAAILALAPVAGVKCGSAARGAILRPGRGGSHGYHPELSQMNTGFIAWGNGVRPGARLPLLSIEDIAAIIARLLALDFEAPDGVAAEGVLQPAATPGRMRP